MSVPKTNYPHKALSNNDPDALPPFKIDVVEFWSLTIQKKLPTTRETTRCCKAYHTLINSAWIGCGSQRHAVTWDMTHRILPTRINEQKLEDLLCYNPHFNRSGYKGARSTTEGSLASTQSPSRGGWPWGRLGDMCWGKGDRCVAMATLLPYCADCLEVMDDLLCYNHHFNSFGYKGARCTTEGSIASSQSPSRGGWPWGRLGDMSWGKGGWCVAVATLLLSCADRLEILGASTSWCSARLSRPVIG